MPKLPRDPLVDLERGVLRNAKSLKTRFRHWLDEHPGEVPPPEVLLAQRVAQDCAEMINKVRLLKAKQHLQERIAAAKLPDVDQALIDAEVARLIQERFDLLTAYDFQKLMNERRQEEKRAREQEGEAMALESGETEGVNDETGE